MLFPAVFKGVPSGKYPTSFTNKARGRTEPGDVRALARLGALRLGVRSLPLRDASPAVSPEREQGASLRTEQEASRNKCHASSNKCLTSSNKKLLGAPGRTTRSKDATNGARGNATNGARGRYVRNPRASRLERSVSSSHSARPSGPSGPDLSFVATVARERFEWRVIWRQSCST